MTTLPRGSEQERADDRPTTSHPGGPGRRSGAPSHRAKRATAAVLGGLLLVRGLRRRSFRGAATALAGGWLLYRALGGRGRFERARRPESGGWDDSQTEQDRTTTVSRSVTVGRPADDLYEAWRDPARFSRVFGHFADVTAADGDRFRWTVHGPGGTDVSWETRVVEAEPGELIRWETTEDGPLANEGTVRFRPASGDRGTVVTLTVAFDPPGGTLWNAALRRFDVVPKALVGTALGRFKSLAETGEIQTLAANPSGRGRGDLL